MIVIKILSYVGAVFGALLALNIIPVIAPVGGLLLIGISGLLLLSVIVGGEYLYDKVISDLRGLLDKFLGLFKR